MMNELFADDATTANPEDRTTISKRTSAPHKYDVVLSYRTPKAVALQPSLRENQSQQTNTWIFFLSSTSSYPANQSGSFVRYVQSPDHMQLNS